MIITTRFTTGTYVARAKGQNVTASCAESPRRAAERVAEKLGLNPELLELEEDCHGVCTFSLPEESPTE
ncbi:hypothetical protein [uncultured Pseudomonas sp.]|uniref:hypothetical protein n=1 Tax=uncultured Pseudomonas sp. TaxID=114707 RepID=UPI0025E588AC|nr:hypothetical protein [uncultured Pseudomonas sp.]